MAPFLYLKVLPRILGDYYKVKSLNNGCCLLSVGILCSVYDCEGLSSSMLSLISERLELQLISLEILCFNSKDVSLLTLGGRPLFFFGGRPLFFLG